MSVIWPTDFTCPMFSATRAMTAGRNIGSTANVNVGAWNSGSPIHGADVDPRRVDVAEHQRQHVPDDDGHEDRQPTDDAAEERERGHQQHQRDDADQRALLEVRSSPPGPG